MTKKDQANLAITIGAGLFIWGLAGYSRGTWGNAQELRMAVGAMLLVGGFLWRPR